MKCCKDCQKVKPLEDFYEHLGNLDGREGTCKACRKIQNRLRYQRLRAARDARKPA